MTEITLYFKDGCEKCEESLERLTNFLEKRPWKYGSRITMEIRQDYMGGGWHLEVTKIDNGEAEQLREEYKKSMEKGNPDYNIQRLLDNLSWYDSYDEIEAYDGLNGTNIKGE